MELCFKKGVLHLQENFSHMKTFLYRPHHATPNVSTRWRPPDSGFQFRMCPLTFGSWSWSLFPDRGCCISSSIRWWPECPPEWWLQPEGEKGGDCARADRQQDRGQRTPGPGRSLSRISSSSVIDSTCMKIKIIVKQPVTPILNYASDWSWLKALSFPHTHSLYHQTNQHTHIF